MCFLERLRKMSVNTLPDLDALLYKAHIYVIQTIRLLDLYNHHFLVLSSFFECPSFTLGLQRG